MYLSIDKEILERVKKRAKMKGLSATSYIRLLLIEDLDK